MAEQQRTRKVGRPQSEYKTQFFQVSMGNGVIKWQCKFCEMQYGSRTGTANFKRHLFNNHPECFNGSVLANPYSEDYDALPLSRNRNGPGSDGPSTPFYGHAATVPSVHVADTGPASVWPDQSLPSSVLMPVSDQAVPQFPFRSPAPAHSNVMALPPSTFGPFGPLPDPPSGALPMPRAQASHPWHPNWSNSPPLPPEPRWGPSSSPCVANPRFERLTTDCYGQLQWLQHSVTGGRHDRQNSSSPGRVHNVTVADPRDETPDAGPASGTKRKLILDVDRGTDGTDAGLDMFTTGMIETLMHAGFTKSEILEQMLTMTVCNPMYLQAFLNDSMHDFFTIANPQFPSLSLSLINDELLHRKREALKALLREHCDTRWSPLLFDVFVFPLLLGDGDSYAIVELVYLDKKGQRRSCLLDCVALADSLPVDTLCAIIASNLRAFEVDSKLGDCTMWGRDYEAANNVLKAKMDCRRRGRADGFWEEEEKKKQFFSVLKKTQEEQFYNIQIEVVQCLSCLDQLEEMLKNGTPVKPVRGTCPNYGVDMKTILSDLQTIFGPNVLEIDSRDDSLEWSLTPSVQMTERFLEIVYKKFNTLQRKMKKLSDLGGNLKRNLNRISCDRKYAVYYIHKNQKNVNLLHIIPVTSYEDSLKDIYHYLKNFMELLKNPGSDGAYEMSDLVADMDLIEIEDCPELSCNKETVYEPKALIENILKIFQDWRRIFQQGVALSREYISLCNYFTGYKNHESNIQSLYAKEFCDVARSAPPHLSPEKWKKVAFLRAWNKFQSSYE